MVFDIFWRKHISRRILRRGVWRTAKRVPSRTIKELKVFNVIIHASRESRETLTNPLEAFQQERFFARWIVWGSR